MNVFVQEDLGNQSVSRSRDDEPIGLLVEPQPCTLHNYPLVQESKLRSFAFPEMSTEMSRDPQSVPGWQTEELQDEWVDLEPGEDGDEDGNLSYGTRSISLTVPLSTHIHTNTDFELDAIPSINNSHAVGTFLVREDVANKPLLPQTPGRNKKGLIKDFFTPLPLERMFDPPSPLSPPGTQAQASDPSPLSCSQPVGASITSERAGDEILETDMPNMNSLHRRKTTMACQFTFSVPRDTSRLIPSNSGPYDPQAQSTPNPPSAPHNAVPSTDPRLRLFQFQYDTYTREHLSALVDSIAINTPSGTGTTATPTNFNQGLSRVSEVSGTAANMSHIRSTKRLKLSPSSDFHGEGAGSRATVSRPKLYGKDYVGESRSLMQQIKQARDFSTISTVASAQDNSPSIDLHDKSQERNLLKSQVLQPPGNCLELYSNIPPDEFIALQHQSVDLPSFLCLNRLTPTHHRKLVHTRHRLIDRRLQHSWNK